MSDNNPANAPPMSSSNDTTRIVKAQIVFLLSTLTEDNFERNQLSIRQVWSFNSYVIICLLILACFVAALRTAGRRYILALHSPTHRPMPGPAHPIGP